MKIAVLYGGTSNERPVSKNTAKSIIKYINSKKYDIEPIDFKGNFESLVSQLKKNNFDLVFNALHGGVGENGELQKIFEQNNITYTGSDSISSGIAMDKHKSKEVCIENSIPTPQWGIIDSSNKDCITVINKIVGDSENLSVVLKPINEGSSFDLFIHNNPFNSSNELTNDFKNHHTHLLNKYGCYMIEKFIQGRELTVGVLGSDTLPPVEILPKNDFYDYESKYSIGMSEYIVPAELDDNLNKNMNLYALKLHDKIGCRHYSRIDFRIDLCNNIYVLELNTLPGMTSTSLLPKAALSFGISYEELVEKIIKLAINYA